MNNSNERFYVCSFGDNLKFLRKVLGLNQEELAFQLDLASPRCVSDYEQGKSMPSPERVIALANKYNVSIDLLFQRNTLDEFIQNFSRR